MYIKRKFRKIISLLLILSSLMGISSHLNIPYASADTNLNWIITDPSEPEKTFDDNGIYWKQTHKTGNESSIRYRTEYFLISKEPFRTGERMNSSYNRSFDKIRVSFNMDKVTSSGGETTNEYRIDYDDFIRAITELGIHANNLKLSDGGIDVYVNPVYGRYTGSYDDPTYVKGAREIIGLQEMLSYSWSEGTQSTLPGLYNKRYVITRDNLYPVEAIAVDEAGNTMTNITDKTGKSISSPFYTDETMYSSPFTYTLPDNLREIKSGTKKYEYTGSFIYNYTSRDHTDEKDTVSGNTLSLGSSPLVLPGSKLIIRYKYAPISEPCNVNVQAVDEAGE